MWEAGLQPESMGSTSSPKVSSEDAAHWRLTGTAQLFLWPSGPPHCWIYNKTPKSPTAALQSTRPFPTRGLCAHPALSLATATTGHRKESNAEQAQALVSWIYFVFCCRWLFSQNTLQQTKTGIAVCRYIAGTGSAFSTSPGGQPRSFLLPLGFHHLLLFIFFFSFFFLFTFFFFFVLFFSFFFNFPLLF